MKHIFPFSEIKQGTRIVLYGASERGYDFYRQIISTGFCELVLWTDRQHEWYRMMNLPVDRPEKIKTASFDLVVLTAEKRSVAESIKRDLAVLGIGNSRIFWKEDCLLKGDIVAGYDRVRVLEEAKQARQDSPNRYLSDERLDVIVRLLYARDLISNQGELPHESLYWKMMLAENDGREPTEQMISAYFSEYSLKRGIGAFKSEFCNLIASMQMDGFHRENFIPIDTRGRIINGAHRLAAALAVHETIWVRSYPFDGIEMNYGESWFAENGFTADEIGEIVQTYKELTT